MKRCAKCGVVKPNQQFAIRIVAKDERQRWCKTCCNDYAREYRAKARLSAVIGIKRAPVDLDAEAVGAYRGLNMEEVRAGNAYREMMALCEAFEQRKLSEDAC